MRQTVHRTQPTASSSRSESDVSEWLGHPAAAAIAAALVAVVLYYPSVHYEFAYDDFGIIVGDARLDEPAFGLGVWIAPWWPEGSAAPASRPLTTFTFWLQNQIHGRNPLWFHAVNIGLFMVLCGQVALLTRRWIGTAWAAWGAGLLFAAHPIHVEVVANVVGRAEVLAAIFAVAALHLWLIWRTEITWRRSILLGLCILLAGLSKEHGYLIAPVIGLMEIAARRVEGRPILGRPLPWRPAAVIAVVALLAVTQRVAMNFTTEEVSGSISDIDNPLTSASVSERIVTPFKLIGKAAQLLAIPLNQSPDYSPRVLMPTDRLGDPLVLLGLFVLAMWGLAVGWSWRRRRMALGPLLAIPVAWFIPSNTLLLIGTIFAERLLTMLTLFVPIALIGLIPIRRLPKVAAGGVGLLIALGVCGYSMATVFYSPAWRDGETLEIYTVANHPRSGRFQGFLARDLMQRGLVHESQRRFFYEQAEHHANLALRFWPRQAVPYEVLGVIAEERGQADRARQYFLLARRASPKVTFGDRGLDLLGDLPDYQTLKQREADLTAVLERNPNDRAAMRKLADVYVHLKEPKKAADLYDRAVGTGNISHLTDTDLIANYIEALLSQRRYEDIVRLYRRWMELDPDNWSLLTDAAIISIAGEVDMERARRWLGRARQLSPGSPEPWAAMGDWHRKAGNEAAAERAYREAIQRSGPNDPKRAHYELMLDRLLGR